MAQQLTDLYSFNTYNGVVMPDTDSIRQSIIDDLTKLVFKADIDTTQETPLGRLIDWLAMAFASIVRLNAANANQFNLNMATGLYLDALGSLFGLVRKSASKTRVPVTLYGTGGTVVPAGVTARTEAGAVFSLESDATIGENGYTTAPDTPFFTAIDYGPVPCAIGELNIIDTAVVGWTGITNGAGTIGGLIESDDEFRERIAKSRYAGDAAVSSVYRAVSSLDCVSSCLVYENCDLPDKVMNGVVVPGHSIYVCVDGISTEESSGDMEAVAKAILKTKSIGCGYATATNGGAAPVAVDVTDEESGMTYTVYFAVAQTVTPKITVQYSMGSYAGDNVEQDIRDAVAAYVNACGIGESLSAFKIGASLMGRFPGLSIASVFFEYEEAPNQINSDFLIYAYQRAVFAGTDAQKYISVNKVQVI